VTEEDEFLIKPPEDDVMSTAAVAMQQHKTLAGP